MGFEQYTLGLSHSKIGDKFIEYLDEGVIPATKCSECGEKFFPPKADCEKCMSSDMEWMGLDVTTGELLAFTKIYVPGEHFSNFNTLSPEGYKPIPIGILRLEEEEVNLMGWIPDLDESDIEVGMELEAEAKKVDAERLTLPLVRKLNITPDLDTDNLEMEIPDDLDEDKIPSDYYTIVLEKP